MKGFASLLPAVFFSLCLFFAAPFFAAGKTVLPTLHQEQADILPISRADRLILLSNVASLWNLHVSIGEKRPDSTAQPEITFGLVKNGELSPAFVARTALQICLTDENAPRSGGAEWEAPHSSADVPRRYNMRISYNELEIAAREWLGWPFDRSALPQAEYILQKNDCLYADVQSLLNSWPSPKYDCSEHDVFAQSFKIRPEQDTWIIQGEIWDIQETPNGSLNVNVCDTFRLTVKKADGYWRILSLDFNV